MPTAHEVRDVMSTEPVTVTRLTPFKDLVELFSSRRISAAPVLDSRNRVVGVVSQTDLLPKEAFRDHEPSRREQLLHLEEMLKAGGTTAGDLMTAPAVVIGPHAGLAEAGVRPATTCGGCRSSTAASSWSASYPRATCSPSSWFPTSNSQTRSPPVSRTRCPTPTPAP
jgi:hypothetical protein